MTALSAARHHVGSPVGVPARPARARHLVSVPTGEAVPERAKGGLRLTRRGRLAMTTTMAAASVAGAGLALAGPAAAPQEVTVEPGQTLGSIARAEMSGVPTGEAVTQLQLANGLSSTHVHAGQTLTIPTP